MNKETAKRIIPAPVWRLGSSAYWAWHNRGRHVLARTFNPRWRHSVAQLEKYRDAYLGKRCFIIGNGPSLRQTDMSLLESEYTFGLNRIYLLFPELGFNTSFLVSVNDLVLGQSATEMKQLNMPKFVTWRARKWFHNDPKTIFLDTDYTGEENFSPEATKRIYEGYTVTYVALQLAFFMGFQQVILIGVDHSFTTQGTANQAVVSQGDDPNHFSANYFGKGYKWQLPDLEGSERAYKLAHDAYSRARRSVVDATVGGKLTVFPKVDYTQLEFPAKV